MHCEAGGRSVAQSCLTLRDPMDCSTPDFSVHHNLLQFVQTYVHWVGDAIQPSHPLLPSSLPALHLSQHQGLFQWVGSSHQVAKRLKLQVLPMNSQSWLPLTGLISLQSKGLTRAFSSITVWKHQYFGAQITHGSTLTSIYDYWKIHSFDYTELCKALSRSSLVAQSLKPLPAMWETWVQSLGQEDPLEKEMATHSSILGWRIPWMEGTGGL